MSHLKFKTFNHSEEITTISKRKLLNPNDSALILIDHQPQLACGVQSIDRQTLKKTPMPC